MIDNDSPTVPVQSQCWSCAHRSPTDPTKCEAFPTGIPILILAGMFDHTMPYDFDGVTDHGLTYFPKHLDSPDNP